MQRGKELLASWLMSFNDISANSFGCKSSSVVRSKKENKFMEIEGGIGEKVNQTDAWE